MPNRIRAWKPGDWHHWADRLLKRLHSTALVSTELRQNPPTGPFEVLALGKAAWEMAQAVPLAGLTPERTLVVTTEAEISATLPENWLVIHAQHPVPGPGSFHAGREVLERITDPSGPAEILVLLSGGTSSLLAAPPEAASRCGFTEEDKADLHRHLVRAGLSIMDINLIRRHCSGVKGGAALRLALRAGKRVTVLAVSDVYSDEPGDIGSGPFAPDRTSFAEALQVARKIENFPESAMEWLKDGAQGRWGENLRQEEIPPDQWRFVFLARPGDALNAACHDLAESGGIAVPCPLWINSEWLGIDTLFLRWLKYESLAPGSWAVAIGEAEVNIPPGARPGKGGRASHLLIRLAGQLHLHGRPFEIGVLATDGIDGTSDLGGGFLATSDIEPFTFAHLEGTLEAFDSANFLKNIGRSFPGRRTGTNFGDILILRWLS